MRLLINACLYLTADQFLCMSCGYFAVFRNMGPSSGSCEVLFMCNQTVLTPSHICGLPCIHSQFQHLQDNAECEPYNFIYIGMT